MVAGANGANGAAIRLAGITKRFKDKLAVDNLDLVVPTGSVCGFLGPNGAGKTTTIRMIMSIFNPDAGDIEVLGRRSAIESKDRIGYLPEERGVYRKMKVKDFLTYIGVLKGVDRGQLAKWIDEWLEKVELPGVQKKKCEELSKGMQQKVQFLAAIIHDPELVILDEPFSGLDPVNARLLRRLIDELHAQGKTIIFSTHVLHSAEQVCERIFMINNGQKILDGTIDEIRTQYDPKSLIVEPANGSLAEARSALGAVRGVHSVHDSTFVGCLEAQLDEGVDASELVSTVAAATPVRRVEIRRATLEDIFVHLVDPGDSEDSIRASLSDTTHQGGA
ncbi:MAG: ATP-binding cassette domain-containing protein [Phycisphaerales bacterium]|nr:ATP-binding cassette domain-containing protein [Phycisphaerales bacterium]